MSVSIENAWHKQGGLWRDPDLERVKRSPLNYRPRPFSAKDCLPDSVLTLRGPRRSGKTVALKLLVADLVENHGFPPQSILWVSFEGLRTLDQADEVLQAIANRTNIRAAFVDEVTSIVGWQKLIKRRKDEGQFRDLCLILTGSSAFDLRAGAERMAGRRGSVENPDRALLPMGFRDFERQLEGHSKNLNDADLIERFFEVGGFPFRVEAFLDSLATGAPFDPFARFQVFDDVFFFEINRRRLDRNVAIELVGRLAAVRSNAISVEALSKPMSVSRETAKRYADALGDAFLLSTIWSFDVGRGRVAPRKDRKFLWVDPALCDFSAWLGAGERSDDASKAETAVAAELLRRHERRLWEGLSAPRNVFTWKSSGGNEVDFLAWNPAIKLRAPVEVKFQQNVSDWDFQVMERAFGSGCLVTKNESRLRPKSRAVALANFLRGAHA